MFKDLRINGFFWTLVVVIALSLAITILNRNDFSSISFASLQQAPPPPVLDCVYDGHQLLSFSAFHVRHYRKRTLQLSLRDVIVSPELNGIISSISGYFAFSSKSSFYKYASYASNYNSYSDVSYASYTSYGDPDPSDEKTSPIPSLFDLDLATAVKNNSDLTALAQIQQFEIELHADETISRFRFGRAIDAIETFNAIWTSPTSGQEDSNFMQAILTFAKDYRNDCYPGANDKPSSIPKSGSGLH